jgi:rSAM/selenodomain-associated transferase 2
MQLSIIIPVLNEAAHIERVLHALHAQRSAQVEIIVVDGGSGDDTCRLAAPFADSVLHAARGRAVQMNVGATAARGEIFLFLHADTVLPDGAPAMIIDWLRNSKHCWGRFDVDIHGRSPVLKVIATLMNWRSRLTGIATGDQALFVRAEDFRAIGGFPPQPLMEDIELSKRLKQRSAPLCLRARVATSGRRWETYGIWRTIVLMWRLRLRYWLGTPADILVKEYR